MRTRTCAICLVALTLLIVGAALVQAGVTVNEKRFHFVGLEIPCTGDFVRLEGTLHVVMSSTHNAAGGYTLTSQVNPQEMSGVSLRGISYRGTGVSRETFTVLPPFPRETTSVNSFMIVGQGSGNDIKVYMIMHYTVDANGEFTADVYYERASCGSGG